MNMFAEKAKSLRLKKRGTLRDFCEQIGLDPSNWSKMERGVNSPPSDVAALERRGLIRRVPGQARSIILTVPPESLPPLKRTQP